jgi:hypothetical protein
MVCTLPFFPVASNFFFCKKVASNINTNKMRKKYENGSQRPLAITETERNPPCCRRRPEHLAGRPWSPRGTQQPLHPVEGNAGSSQTRPGYALLFEKIVGRIRKTRMRIASENCCGRSYHYFFCGTVLSLLNFSCK